MVELNRDNIVELERYGNGSNDNAKELYFERVDINDVDPDVFDAYSSLKVLGFSLNQITDIRPGLFNYVRELETLKLMFNKLSSMSSDTFRYNRKLREIDLQYNELEGLPSAIFHNLPELEILSLHHNRLWSFDLESLKDSPKLKELYLNGNNLLAIDNFHLHKTLWKNLKILDLTNNRLCALDEMRKESNRGIVRLDVLNSQTPESAKMCEMNAEMNYFAAVWKEEKKQLTAKLEASQTKLAEVEKDLTLKDALQAENEELKEREKAREGTNAIVTKVDSLQELMIKLMGERQKEIEELSKKLDNFVICKVDQKKINPEIPLN